MEKEQPETQQGNLKSTWCHGDPGKKSLKKEGVLSNSKCWWEVKMEENQSRFII